MPDDSRDPAAKHTIPVIDRMMDVLNEIGRREAGAGIRELTDVLGVPRTTTYRILNTLQRHDMVRRDETGAYHLGRHLLSLASHVSAKVAEIDLAAIGQPFLDRLAAELGEGVKLSVIDRDGVLVLAVAQGRREYALTVSAGQRLPAHAGAAGKLLLAHQPPDEIERWLARPLPEYTAKTLTDPARLRRELARIVRVGWAQDKGETAPSIQAFAAPVFGASGRLLAALSVPFLAGTPAERMEAIRRAAIDAGRGLSAAMPG
ncbi:MAG: IclR family transcriptional regulator [Alphaproteobacteria bacterium]